MLALDGPYGVGADAFRLAGWLTAAGLTGAIVYLVAAALLRVPELREAWVLVRRVPRE